jgi:hypothetical protein
MTSLTIRFGVPPSEIPHPSADWKEFINMIESLNKRELKVWSPIRRRPESWINEEKLAHLYDTRSACTGCSIM